MINYSDFLKTVDLFRDFSLNKFTDDIDLILPKNREGRLGAKLKGDYNLQASIMRSIDPLFNEPVDYVVRLLKTPRLLKMTLRRMLSAWEHLHGEIDYDDLFVAIVLRFSAPEAYDFLLQNMGAIRALNSGNDEKKLLIIRDHINSKWTRFTANVEWDVEAAEGLIIFLFPAWSEKSFDSVALPQGIRHYYPTDYWQRLNAEFILETETPDQEIFRTLKKWKADHNNVVIKDLTLPKALYSLPSLSPQLEQFAAYFLDDKDIRDIAASLIKVILQDKGVKANWDSCVALSSLWRLSFRLVIKDEDEHMKWVLDQILQALPLSLRLANDLYGYWRNNGHHSPQNKTPKLRSLVINNFKALFVNNPVAFIASLDPLYIYIVNEFAVTYSLPDNGGDGFEPSEWRWLAKLMLDAARVQAAIVLPHIIPLIVDSPYTGLFRTFIFNNERANALFGDDLPELMHLLARTSFEKVIPEGILDQISFAQHEANKWLLRDKM